MSGGCTARLGEEESLLASRAVAVTAQREREREKTKERQGR